MEEYNKFKCPTVQIKSGDSFLIINKEDYDPDVHEIYEEPKASKTTEKAPPPPPPPEDPTKEEEKKTESPPKTTTTTTKPATKGAH